MRALPFLVAAYGILVSIPAGPAGRADASQLRVNPVLAEIDEERRTASVSVRNEEAAPVVIRIYALSWRQEDGQDVYSETTEIIVSPPVATIQPGETQLIRMGLRRPSSDARAYRLIIEEVPEAARSSGINVALRLNLPLFVMTPRGDPDGLVWSSRRGENGGWIVEAHNPGPGYVRLDQESARDGSGIDFPDDVHFGTILPGAVRRWSAGQEPAIANASRFQEIQERENDAVADQGGG